MFFLKVPQKRMVHNQMGLPAIFAALKTQGAKQGCSGGFGWGYSEKVPNATGNEVTALSQTNLQIYKTCLEPNSDSMQEPIGGRLESCLLTMKTIGGGSLLASFQVNSTLKTSEKARSEDKQRRNATFQDTLRRGLNPNQTQKQKSNPKQAQQQKGGGGRRRRADANSKPSTKGMLLGSFCRAWQPRESPAAY